jgi:hypothetical protein
MIVVSHDIEIFVTVGVVGIRPKITIIITIAVVEGPHNIRTGNNRLMAVRAIVTAARDGSGPHRVKPIVGVIRGPKLILSLVTHVEVRVTATTAINLPAVSIGIGEKFANLGKTLVTVKNRRIELKSAHSRIGLSTKEGVTLQGRMFRTTGSLDLYAELSG